MDPPVTSSVHAQLSVVLAPLVFYGGTRRYRACCQSAPSPDIPVSVSLRDSHESATRFWFHLYGMTRDEAAYVLDTFPIVERRDREQFGKYRTKELILHYWSAYNAGDMGAWVAG